ncbi:helicase-exonuclease AddAB subunit AddA [Hominifimenecus sp. rT4P-3]|uniref:helicase-exonuclease AddAB subunit AddA n=1 Tax=Hominifimenecus sp. rT4P-3 TaxID=3242979 RepID=UPI003DA6C1DE
MAAQWTSAQQAVIDSRNCNLLVAAAAGSGKTAVLIEHILSRILDEKQPVDMDRLLIVTFTKAAAAEMRERLTRALEEAMEKNPKNFRLERQISLLPHAHISTIDSFCMWVVKNHFPLLDLDPDFRVGEDGELKLLRGDVLDTLLEERYQEQDPDFLSFADAYAGGKNDAALVELILQLYDFSQSAPYPKEWLDSCRKRYGEENSCLDDFPWAKEAMERGKRKLESLKRQQEQAIAEIQQIPDVAAYGPMFLADRELVETLLAPETFSDWARTLSQVKFSRKPSKRGMDEAREVQERLSSLRDFIKAEVETLRKKYCLDEPESMFETIRALEKPMNVLIDLTEAFADAYLAAKKERNLAEFSDVSHWALELLDGPSELALSLGKQFDEIAVDEYQDSNLIQERILTAISGIHRGQPNLFFVGDVKQSIYKFRQAKPELFLEKYETYSNEADARERKIDLNKNFRTRPCILDAVNHLFFQLMGKELGGIAYNKDAALYPGASYPPDVEPIELLYGECEESTDSREWEAKIIAGRIRELMDPDTGMQVWDAKRGESRPLQFQDIIILLRTTEGWADEFASLLTAEGIPAVTQEKKGYFSAIEVQVMLNLLKIIDNPCQDIPLAAVLLSPIGGLDEEELAMLPKEEGPEQVGFDTSLYSRCRRWGGEKLQKFLKRLDWYRECAVHLPIYELLDLVMEDTSYGLYLSALPLGAMRRANIDMLREKAMEFESTSLHGLFQFNRYMEKAQKYEVDYGPASIRSEQDDLVRITSIHKSKGLEYPVVFVAGLSKPFNLQDARKRVIFHEEGGIASDVIDGKRMVKMPCLYKQALADQTVRETKGEELRILYVALTRAREKLILTASGKSLADAKAKSQMACSFCDPLLPGWFLETANSYLDWVLMALARDVHGFLVRNIPMEELIVRETESLGRSQWLRAALESGAIPGTNPELREEWESRLTYRYPYEALTRVKSAYSVSELKENRLPEEDRKEKRKRAEESASRHSDEEGGNLDGAERGTAYHKVMEVLSPEDGTDTEKIRAQVERLFPERPELVQSIRAEEIAAFYRSELGARTIHAARNKKRQTEHPFVMGIPASELSEKVQGDELVLVQGIIDLYLEEEDGLVLIDYKTDSVGESVLLARYRGQLAYYKMALERAVGKPVKEAWIYSFPLRKAVEVWR